MTNCPEPTAIADLVDGRLSPVEVVGMEQHLDSCSRCAELVAVAVSTHGDTTLRLSWRREVLPEGTRLGRYEVRRWIGRGGMGDVYEAFDPSLQRRVAIKVLRQLEEDDSHGAPQRLEREARTLARLSHANVVAALDMGLVGEQLFLVMELVEGPTLAAWLKAAPRSWRQILDVFLEAGEGLAAAHDLGIVHRDFKPQNVLIGPDGKARVSDFGLARLLAAERAGRAPEESDPPQPASSEWPNQNAKGPQTVPAGLTSTGALVGTPRYMAPEQYSRQAADARVDQFSFCVALFEAIYGWHPFLEDPRGAGTPHNMVRSISVRETSPRRGKEETPRTLHAALIRGMARQPAERFPSLRTLLSAIRDVTKVSSSRRFKTITAAAAAIVLLAGVALAWRARVRGDSPPLLIPAGAPADLSDAPIVARISGVVHCTTSIGAGTIRVVWGLPRQVEDIDIASGARRPTNLLPQTYRYGCPELSPDGRQLIYEGYDTKDRPNIFHADNATGQDAEPIVSCVEPTFDSHPRWLSSGRAFVFDVGLRHPAVFSLDSNSFTVVSDKNRQPDSLTGFTKSTSRIGDRFAVVETDQAGPLLINIYRWPGLDTLAKFRTVAGSIRWRFGLDPDVLYGRLSEVPASYVALDVRTGRLSRLATAGGDRDISEYMQIDDARAAITTTGGGAKIFYRARDGKERMVPQKKSDSFAHPTALDDGTILVGSFVGGGSHISRFFPSVERLVQVTDGPADFSPTALPGRSWLMGRRSQSPGTTASIFRCQLADDVESAECQMINAETPQTFLAAAPGGRHYVYNFVRDQEILIRVASLEDGRVTDLVNRTTGCQLLWSSATTVWISRRVGRDYQWLEMDVLAKKPTGKTAPGTTGCFDSVPDFNPPISTPVWTVSGETWDLRVVSPLRPPR